MHTRAKIGRRLEIRHTIVWYGCCTRVKDHRFMFLLLMWNLFRTKQRNGWCRDFDISYHKRIGFESILAVGSINFYSKYATKIRPIFNEIFVTFIRNVVLSASIIPIWTTTKKKNGCFQAHGMPTHNWMNSTERSFSNSIESQHRTRWILMNGPPPIFAYVILHWPP